eukprot:COSAG06_NODE_30434_length_539_cov_0.581818_1_plen_152_part_01
MNGTIDAVSKHTHSATPLDISAVLANPKVGAVLHLGVPSVTVLGVEAVLYGDTSPAAKTVQTFYESSYQDSISIFDFGMRPGPSKFARPDCTDSQNASSCPRGTNPGRSQYAQLLLTHTQTCLTHKQVDSTRIPPAAFTHFNVCLAGCLRVC